MVVVSTPTIVGVEARGCHCHRMTSGMGARPRSVVARSSPNVGGGAGGWWWALALRGCRCPGRRRLRRRMAGGDRGARRPGLTPAGRRDLQLPAVLGLGMVEPDHLAAVRPHRPAITFRPRPALAHVEAPAPLQEVPQAPPAALGDSG